MIDGPLHPAGMQEVRENLRSLLQVLDQGIAVAILQHGEIVAVMLDEDDVDRCRHADMALATVHGMGFYPELARDTSELEAILWKRRDVSRSAIEELASRPREVLGIRESTNPSEFRHFLSRYIKDVVAGRPLVLVDGGRFKVTVVSNREFNRLGHLRRVMRWFEAAGLDLSKANPPEIERFFRAYGHVPDGGEPDVA